MEKTKLKSGARASSIICALVLFIALLHLPIAYYRFLRVVVFTGALLVIYRSRKEGFFWLILFIIIAILFNPILPIYLYKRSIWMPLDIAVGILFLLEVFLNKEEKETSIKREPEREPKQEEKTYHRDRIL